MDQPAMHLTVADIMSKQIVTVLEDAPIPEIAAIMAKNNIGAVVIVDPGGKVIGILSERDFAFKIIALGHSPSEVKTANIMTRHPKCLPSSTSVTEAFKLTQAGQFRHVPIVDDGILKGMVSVRDINKAFHSERDWLMEIKSKFITITSHELRTPYTILKEYIELLSENFFGECSELQQEACHKMVETIARVEKTLDALAQFYLSGGKTSRRFERSPLLDVLQDSINDTMMFMEKRKLHLHLNIALEMPSVLMSKSEIKQVLFSLLMNAIRFTPDGGTVTLRAKNLKTCLQIEIEDTGIGIPANKLDAVFESFYEVGDDSLHNTSGTCEFKSGGLGLGLAIARQIVESHEGHIWAESEEGSYARFIFTLPKN